jgi:hypothetical protein
MALSDRDLKLIELNGINQFEVNKQLERFKTGFPTPKTIKAATINDGILFIDEKKISKYISEYNSGIKNLHISKFVPASGAATRMFKMPFEFMAWYDGSEEAYAKFLQDKSFYSPYFFIANIHHFAFIEDIKLMLRNYTDTFDILLQSKKYHTILKTLLTDDGLGYGNLPKGLLKFHKYKVYSRTAVEEHVVEGAMHAINNNKEVDIHFTISPDFMDEFQCHIEEVKKTYEPKYHVKYKTTYSVQKPSTNTIAVDENNEPIRTEKGELLFRPGGHGALIENLNAIDSDIIFIKNIDNVVADRFKEQTITYKKLIGGILISVQETAFCYAKKLSKKTKIANWRKRRIVRFLKEQLNVIMPETFDSLTAEQQRDYLFKTLNRPIRVCGMVKNEGEPGGGPFWVKADDGMISLQIIEKAQFDDKDEAQMEMLKNSTHFNPVDIVCSVKDFNGNKFNLSDFVDENAGIITIKSKNGKALKAIELPGLWNGAMANWNTIFVEVPLVTFNPVKEINDLLREEHQDVPIKLKEI